MNFYKFIVIIILLSITNNAFADCNIKGNSPVNPDIDVRLILDTGLELREIKCYKEAIDIFDIGLSYKPSDINLLHQKAITLEWSSRLEDALEIHMSAYGVNPEHLATLLGISRVSKWLGEWDEALLYLNKAMPDISDAEYYYHLADIYFLKQNLAEAKSYIRKAVNLNNQNKAYKALEKKINSHTRYTLSVNSVNESNALESKVKSFSVGLDYQFSSITYLNFKYEQRKDVINPFEFNQLGVPIEISGSEKISVNWNQFYYDTSHSLGVSVSKDQNSSTNWLISGSKFYKLDPNNQFGFDFQYSKLPSGKAKIFGVNYLGKINKTLNWRAKGFVSNDAIGVNTKGVLLALNGTIGENAFDAGISSSRNKFIGTQQTYFLSFRRRLNDSASITASYANSKQLNLKQVTLGLVYRF